MLCWHKSLPKGENRAHEPVQMCLRWEKITQQKRVKERLRAGIHPKAGSVGGQLTPHPAPRQRALVEGEIGRSCCTRTGKLLRRRGCLTREALLTRLQTTHPSAKAKASHNDHKAPVGTPSAKPTCGSPLGPQPQRCALKPVLPTRAGDHLCPGDLSSLRDRGEDRCSAAALDYIKYSPTHGPGSRSALPLSLVPGEATTPPASLHAPSWMEPLEEKVPSVHSFHCFSFSPAIPQGDLCKAEVSTPCWEPAGRGA